MILTKLCSPAFIYVIFSATQIIIDTFRTHYNVAFVKFCVSIFFTILLQFLCERGLGIISWFIVFIPFILMTTIVSMLLVMYGLDPITGKRRNVKEINYTNNPNLIEKNKKLKDSFRFSPYYSNINNRQKGGVHYSQNITNNLENEIEDYLTYKRMQRERIRRRLDSRVSLDSDDEEENYEDIPTPNEDKLNLGENCDFGFQCKTGSCGGGSVGNTKCIEGTNKKHTAEKQSTTAGNTNHEYS
jgi:hypothetical protein